MMFLEARSFVFVFFRWQFKLHKVNADELRRVGLDVLEDFLVLFVCLYNWSFQVETHGQSW